MNVFEMYYANEKKAGFWITRNTWKNMFAKVVSVGGQTEGSLKGMGRYPYFNDAKNGVVVELYKVYENKLVQITPEFSKCEHDNNLAILSCPGTYSYQQIIINDEVNIVRLVDK